MADIRTLWHYLPDYDYRPDLFDYAEFYTSDPDYVVWEVSMMPLGPAHGNNLFHMKSALDILTRSHTPPVHVSVYVDMDGIPGHMRPTARHTSALRPDLAVWAGQEAPDPRGSYQYDRDGGPLLAVEVVSHATAPMAANDWEHKMQAYARMGIGEYWLLDDRQDSPLNGYTLDSAAPDAAEYRRIDVGPGAGQNSPVLGTSLRWVVDTLECWHSEWGRWVPVLDIPVLEAAFEADARARAEAVLGFYLDLFLAMGLSRDICCDLGLDLLCMDTVPGSGALMQTQGDLGLLRRRIPARPQDRDTAAARHYVMELLRACPSYPANDFPGDG